MNIYVFSLQYSRSANPVCFVMYFSSLQINVIHFEFRRNVQVHKLKFTVHLNTYK